MSPYNVPDPVKSANSFKGAAAVARREKRPRADVAEQLVRDWSPEQRARIKADPLTTPELAYLIDTINEQEEQ